MRSSGISSGAADSAVVESSHSFQAAFHPCFQRVSPCHRVLREELLLLVLGTRMQFRDLEAKKGGMHDIDSRKKTMEGPAHLYHGLSAGPASRWALRVSDSFFLFCSALLPVTLGGLTANAAPNCLCFAEVYVDREVRRLISFLLFAPCLCSVESFHAWQLASSVYSFMLL